MRNNTNYIGKPFTAQGKLAEQRDRLSTYMRSLSDKHQADHCTTHTRFKMIQESVTKQVFMVVKGCFTMVQNATMDHCTKIQSFLYKHWQEKPLENIQGLLSSQIRLTLWIELTITTQIVKYNAQEITILLLI